MVVVLALAAHAFARPFKDKVVDACEFFSLLSTLIIFQSAMVWNSMIDTTGKLSVVLENVCMGLVLVVTVFGFLAQARAVKQSLQDPDRFTPRHIYKMSLKELKHLCRKLYIQGICDWKPGYAIDPDLLDHMEDPGLDLNGMDAIMKVTGASDGRELSVLKWNELQIIIIATAMASHLYIT
eukprot:COSAG02_NODE_7388_length_3037_cov_2.941116_2_plen_181_part_00